MKERKNTQSINPGIDGDFDQLKEFEQARERRGK